MLKRTIIKLSGEAIGNPSSLSGYNDEVIDSIVGQIAGVVTGGTQVSLVVGGGNLWRGHQARPDMDRVKADNIGMLATVMNAIYLAEAFKRQGAAAVVLTPVPFSNMTKIYEKDMAVNLMAKNVILINAAGLGHPYFSTDTITALRAAELEADCILFAKNIDGVYDSDPRQNPQAKKYRNLNYDTAIKNGLKAADLAAMHLANDASIPSYAFALSHPNSINLACAYPDTEQLNGTYITSNIQCEFYNA